MPGGGPHKEYSGPRDERGGISSWRKGQRRASGSGRAAARRRGMASTAVTTAVVRPSQERWRRKRGGVVCGHTGTIPPAHHTPPPTPPQLSLLPATPPPNPTPPPTRANRGRAQSLVTPGTYLSTVSSRAQREHPLGQAACFTTWAPGKQSLFRYETGPWSTACRERGSIPDLEASLKA